MEINECAPAHGAPTESGVRDALPYGKGDEDIYVWFVDLARPGGRYVRYLSDPRPGPGAGFWRAHGTQQPARISPFAILRIDPGRHGVAVGVVLPGGGETRRYEGSTDDVASEIHRAGKRIGDRQALFWALTDLCNEIRRQAAARGAEL